MLRHCTGCEALEARLAAKCAELNAALVELGQTRTSVDMLQALWGTLSDNDRRECLARIFDTEAGKNG